tara:strand:- start:675 stop:1034 length:360 start_codon:yes stop_codon:yes gene_type:complete
MKYLLMIKKMKKILKNTFYLFVALVILSACQSVKDGLTGKKTTNSDEFLVKKKNPLTLPPNFKKLPIPATLTKNNDEDINDIDIEKILTKNKSITNTTPANESTNRSLEKSILEKIKSN